MEDDFEPHHTFAAYRWRPHDTIRVLVRGVPLLERRDYRLSGREIHVAHRFDPTDVAIQQVQGLSPQQKRNGTILERY